MSKEILNTKFLERVIVEREVNTWECRDELMRLLSKCEDTTPQERKRIVELSKRMYCVVDYVYKHLDTRELNLKDKIRTFIKWTRIKNNYKTVGKIVSKIVKIDEQAE